MTRWEYLMVTQSRDGGFDLVERLNELGSEGWDVVTFEHHAMSNHIYALLKREKIDSNP